MTAWELRDALDDLSHTHDLTKLQVIIRLESHDEDTHMGGLASVVVESGCTDTPALVLDCDQDPTNCPLEDVE